MAWNNRTWRWLAATVACALAAACQYADPRLEPGAVNATRTTIAAGAVPARQADRDGWFVGVAISGGGSRSANWGAATIQELRQSGMMDHVDFVSCVSGGTLPAALWCGAPDGAWEDQRIRRVLRSDITTYAAVNALMPPNLFIRWLTLASRSDYVAMAIDELVLQPGFGGSPTYGDLRADRPRLLVNATDMTTQQTFVFENLTFDEIGSDLGRMKLSRAMAASASPPGLLHPTTLKDWKKEGYYRQLIDGGVIDNLGVRTLVKMYADEVRAAEKEGRKSAYENGAVFIVIDAAGLYTSSELARDPNPSFMTGLASGVSMSTTAFIQAVARTSLTGSLYDMMPGDLTVTQARERMKQLMDTGIVTSMDRGRLPVHIVHFSIGRVRTLDAELGARIEAIATAFDIRESEQRDLFAASSLLYSKRYAAEVQRLVEMISRQKGSGPPAAPATEPTGAQPPVVPR